jgi:hypothetical protein
MADDGWRMPDNADISHPTSDIGHRSAAHMKLKLSILLIVAVMAAVAVRRPAPVPTDRDWRETVIGHTTKLISADPAGQSLKLRCTLNDGVIVDHTISATQDEVDFRLTAHNPTKEASQAHWAQPCMRVDRFTGLGQKDYLPKCFIFRDGKPARLPFEPWAMKARYVPGQVWRAPGVGQGDVNPRPQSEVAPSNGLIGCVSADENWLLAMAWEPYQELFQGVIVCLHSDFRIGGLKPGETKKIRGKLHYFGPWDKADHALEKYLDQRDDLHAGRAPRVSAEGVTVRDLVNRFLTAKQQLLDSEELSPRTFADLLDLFVDLLIVDWHRTNVQRFYRQMG